MTDINPLAAVSGVEPWFLREEEVRHGIELLFFAYRDFTAEPDAILAQYGFGRAHHRVVHFVGRHPQGRRPAGRGLSQRAARAHRRLRGPPSLRPAQAGAALTAGLPYNRRHERSRAASPRRR